MTDTIALSEAAGIPSLSDSAAATTVIAPAPAIAPAGGTDRSSLHRVRERLAEHGLSLALTARPDGWTWDIPESPLQTRRTFDSIKGALEHADTFTRIWYSQAI